MGQSGRTVLGGVFIVLAAAVSGCGAAMRGAEVSQSEALSPDAISQQIELGKIQTDLAVVQTDLNSGLAALEGLLNPDGSLSMPVISAPGTSGPMKSLFDRITEAVGLLNTGLDEARTKITELRGRLNLADPAQAALIEQIDLALTQLEVLDDQLEAALARVVDAVDAVVAKIDQARSGLNPLNPGELVLSLALSSIKSMLVDFVNGLSI